MSLSAKQARFTLAVGRLILFAHEKGYRLTHGDAYRDPRATFPYSSRSSRHGMRLAIDFNLYKKNVPGPKGRWQYRTKTDDHAELGAHWKSLGGIWGGDFPDPDGNHYEWPL